MNKILAAWAFIGAHVVPAIVLLVATVFLATRVQSCGDKRQGEKAAVMSERVRVDTIIDSANAAALQRTETQLKDARAEIVRLVNQPPTVIRIPVGTPHDTITHLTTAVRACEARRDTLVQSVIKFRSSCDAFRDTANKTIADLRLARSHLDSLLKIGKPPKRWALGLFLGFGLHTDSAFAIRRGLVAGVGITRSIVQF